MCSSKNIFLTYLLKFNLIPSLIFGILFVLTSCINKTDFIKSDIIRLKEPQVRVRIINTLDTVQIRFSDNWTGYADNQTEVKFSQDDQINITLSDNQIHIDKNDRSEIHSCDSLRIVV